MWHSAEARRGGWQCGREGGGGGVGVLRTLQSVSMYVCVCRGCRASFVVASAPTCFRGSRHVRCSAFAPFSSPPRCPLRLRRDAIRCLCVCVTIRRRVRRLVRGPPPFLSALPLKTTATTKQRRRRSDANNEKGMSETGVTDTHTHTRTQTRSCWGRAFHRAGCLLFFVLLLLCVCVCGRSGACATLLLWPHRKSRGGLNTASAAGTVLAAPHRRVSLLGASASCLHPLSRSCEPTLLVYAFFLLLLLCLLPGCNHGCNGW